jgi:hypothetical protein
VFRVQGLGLGWVKFRVIKTPLSGVHVSVRVTYMCLLVFLPIYLSMCLSQCMSLRSLHVSLCLSACLSAVPAKESAGARALEKEGERVCLGLSWREREYV